MQHDFSSVTSGGPVKPFQVLNKLEKNLHKFDKVNIRQYTGVDSYIAY